jgi:hypothetical protein
MDVSWQPFGWLVFSLGTPVCLPAGSPTRTDIKTVHIINRTAPRMHALIERLRQESQFAELAFHTVLMDDEDVRWSLSFVMPCSARIATRLR